MNTKENMTTFVTNGKVVYADRQVSVDGGYFDKAIAHSRKWEEIPETVKISEKFGIPFVPKIVGFVGNLNRGKKIYDQITLGLDMFSLADLHKFEQKPEDASDSTILFFGSEGEVYEQDEQVGTQLGAEYFQKKTAVFGSGSGFTKLVPNFSTADDEELLDYFLMCCYYDDNSSLEYNKITLGKKPTHEFVHPTEERVRQAFSRYFNPMFYQPSQKIFRKL